MTYLSSKETPMGSKAMNHRKRRGISFVQYAVVAGLLVLVVVAGTALLGTRANTKLQQTATDVGNPTSLTTRFGS
jgi:Flp pilus assembly pilin Flp